MGIIQVEDSVEGVDEAWWKLIFGCSLVGTRIVFGTEAKSQAEGCEGHIRKGGVGLRVGGEAIR